MNKCFDLVVVVILKLLANQLNFFSKRRLYNICRLFRLKIDFWLLLNFGLRILFISFLQIPVDIVIVGTSYLEVVHFGKLYTFSHLRYQVNNIFYKFSIFPFLRYQMNTLLRFDVLSFFGDGVVLVQFKRDVLFVILNYECVFKLCSKLKILWRWSVMLICLNLIRWSSGSFSHLFKY